MTRLFEKIKNTSQNIITLTSALTISLTLMGNMINSYYINKNFINEVKGLIPVIRSNQVYVSINLDEELYSLNEKLLNQGKLDIRDTTKLQGYKNGVYQNSTPYQQAMIDGLIYQSKKH